MTTSLNKSQMNFFEPIRIDQCRLFKQMILRTYQHKQRGGWCAIEKCIQRAVQAFTIHGGPLSVFVVAEKFRFANKNIARLFVVFSRQSKPRCNGVKRLESNDFRQGKATTSEQSQLQVESHNGSGEHHGHHLQRSVGLHLHGDDATERNTDNIDHWYIQMIDDLPDLIGYPMKIVVKICFGEFA